MRVSFFILAANVLFAQVPSTWTDSAVAALEVPLANISPIHISEQAYYEMPTRTIYRSYPVYHPNREPAGYMEWLSKQEPQVAFDAGSLKTPQDWITAGEIV